uniref:Uncharacterized protein n=1 Tax=Desulfobacca acetoxidans TaxID=60893 RepID=A0A7V4LCX7_9BACT
MPKHTPAGRLLLLLTTVVLALSVALPLNAEYPVFYVCLVNKTNNNINYSTQWCTRSGHNCSGYRKWTLAPGMYRKHWGEAGNGRMDVKIHTGGEGGIVLDYSFNGTTDDCSAESTYYIRYNQRGFLRIYED